MPPRTALRQYAGIRPAKRGGGPFCLVVAAWCASAGCARHPSGPAPALASGRNADLSVVAVPGAVEACFLRLVIPADTPDPVRAGDRCDVAEDEFGNAAVAWGDVDSDGVRLGLSGPVSALCGAFRAPENGDMFWYFQVDTRGHRGQLQCVARGCQSQTVELAEPTTPMPAGAYSLQHSGSLGLASGFTIGFGPEGVAARGAPATWETLR
ncbi:MAG: hypothetical protein ACI8RZ_004517, partial [Myxococcota bacterium]